MSDEELDAALCRVMATSPEGLAAKRLLGNLQSLPPRQRAAVVLTYQEGLSNAEVAEVLDTSVSGVETLLVRARRTLRVAFESDQS